MHFASARPTGAISASQSKSPRRLALISPVRPGRFLRCQGAHSAVSSIQYSSWIRS